MQETVPLTIQQRLDDLQIADISTDISIPEELKDSIQDYLETRPDWDQNRVLSAALSMFLMQAKGASDRALSRSYLTALFGDHDSDRPNLRVVDSNEDDRGSGRVDHEAVSHGKQLFNPQYPKDPDYMKWFATGQRIRALQAIAVSESTKQELGELRSKVEGLLADVSCAIVNTSSDGEA